MTATQRHDPDLGVRNSVNLGGRDGGSGKPELARQPVDDLLIRVGILGVRAVLVVTRAAHEYAPWALIPGSERAAMPSPSASR